MLFFKMNFRYILVSLIISECFQDQEDSEIQEEKPAAMGKSVEHSRHHHHINNIKSITFMSREMFLKRAREPYEPNMSAAMMTPPVNFTPSTDVPVTIGLLQERSFVLTDKYQKLNKSDDRQHCIYLIQHQISWGSVFEIKNN